MKGEKGDDGDYQFDLEVEDPYKKLMNTDNTKQVNGMLVIEIMPKDQNDPSTQFQKMVTKYRFMELGDRSTSWLE